MRINKRDFVKAKVNKELSPGEMLKIIRELQELSQKELSYLTGIPQSNISAIESGHGNSVASEHCYLRMP